MRAAKRLFRGRAVPYSLEDAAEPLQFRGRPEAYSLEDAAKPLQFRGRPLAYSLEDAPLALLKTKKQTNNNKEI